jgi:hypothetical protein
MLYIAKAITYVIPNFQIPFQLFRNQKVGNNNAAKIAGDFVSEAKPRKNPVSIARSYLLYFDVKYPNIAVHIINIESIESTRAILSKNTENGEMAYKKVVANETNLFLKNRYDNTNTPKIVPNPVNTDINLPINKGSLKRLITNIKTHINRGCLPSDKGKNLNVGSEAIT